jgi:Xaa-Pro aminopeptidase
VRTLLRGRSSVNEREVELAFASRARREGTGPGYHVIAAGGAHATTLHWSRNDAPIGAEDLLLLDAGAELNSLYTGDLTRTWPVGGRFSGAQRQVYEHVLAAEQAAIAALRPGGRFRDHYDVCARVLANGLADLGVLPVDPDESLNPDSGLHRRWTLCAPGHMLGLDVHDCSQAREDRYIGGRLRPGMVLTIEPGLYFQRNDELVPPALRGMGIRIEDDILITEDGYEVLSRRLPVEVDELEAWCAS